MIVQCDTGVTVEWEYSVRMSDSDGDSYHEEGFPPLECCTPSLGEDVEGEGSFDSLPDLVLSSTALSKTTQVNTAANPC